MKDTDNDPIVRAARIDRARKYPSPEWGDHNLHGIHERVTAQDLKKVRLINVRESAA